MSKRLPYVYQLTDELTGMKYIGAQWRVSSHPDNLGTVYFSSSAEVSQLYKSDPKRFSSEILFTGSVEEVRSKEIELLKTLDCAKSALFYNLNNGSISIEDSRKGGKVIGAIHRDSGHAERLGRVFGPGNAHHGGKANVKSGHIHRLGKSQGTVNAMNGHLASLRTKEHQSNAARAAGKISGPRIISRRYACVICGLVLSPPSMGNHQKYSGHRGIIK